MIRWNDNLEKMTGYPPEDILSMNALDFFQAEDRPWFKKEFKRPFPGAFFVEATLEAKTGRLTPYLLTGVRVNGG